VLRCIGKCGEREKKGGRVTKRVTLEKASSLMVAVVTGSVM